MHHAKASPSLSERTRFPVDHQLFAIRPACFTPLALRWRDKTRSGRRVSLTAVHREQGAEGEETCGARRDPGMRDRDSFGGAGGQGRASGQLLGPRRRQVRDSRPDCGAGEARRSAWWSSASPTSNAGSPTPALSTNTTSSSSKRCKLGKILRKGTPKRSIIEGTARSW